MVLIAATIIRIETVCILCIYDYMFSLWLLIMLIFLFLPYVYKAINPPLVAGIGQNILPSAVANYSIGVLNPVANFLQNIDLQSAQASVRWKFLLFEGLSSIY